MRSHFSSSRGDSTYLLLVIDITTRYLEVKKFILFLLTESLYKVCDVIAFLFRAVINESRDIDYV